MDRSLSGRMRVDDVRAVVEGFRKAAENLPPVHVLDTTKDAPRAVQKWLRENDAMFDAAGLFHNGEIYLFAAHLTDIEHAQHVFLHEAQHYGLAGLFGNALDESMLYLYQHNGTLKAKADAKQKEDRTLSTVRATEEALADMAGEGKAKTLNGWDKLVATVRDWLRKAGWVGAVTNADVSYLVYRAELYWQRAQVSGYVNVKRGKLARVESDLAVGKLSRAAGQSPGQPNAPQLPTTRRQKLAALSDRVIARMDSAINGLGELPEQAQYLADRYLALGRIAHIDEIAGNIRAAFKRATQTDMKRDIYAYLTTRGATPDAIQDAAVRDMAVKVKAYIGTVGDELVKRVE